MSLQPNIKIIRYEDQIIKNSLYKIIGFSIYLSSQEHSVYHESILTNEEFINKTPEECVNMAYKKIQNVVSESVIKLTNQNNIVGALYIPD